MFLMFTLCSSISVIHCDFSQNQIHIQSLHNVICTFHHNYLVYDQSDQPETFLKQMNFGQISSYSVFCFNPSRAE